MNELWPVVGPWTWWVIAGILLLGELLMPGIFLLWLGIAAVATGVVDQLLDLGWRGEIAAFAILSMLSVFVSWKFNLGMGNKASDTPHLNSPLQAMIGKRFALQQPISNGRGKLKIDDTLWDIEGPDLAAGDTIRVSGLNGLKLIVEKA